MRAKKSTTNRKASGLLRLASDGAMGVALGLMFALIVIFTPVVGVGKLIPVGSDPYFTLLTFVGTCALMFGIGATLTGIVFIVTEDN